VDAATGRTVFVRDEVSTIDVNGTVQGWASAGLYPPDATYAAAALSLQGVSDLKVGLSGSATSTFADRTGSFIFPNSGSTAITLSTGTNALTNLRGGRWVDVRHVGAATQLVTQTVTPPGPANGLILNPTGTTNPANNAGIAPLT